MKTPVLLTRKFDVVIPNLEEDGITEVVPIDVQVYFDPAVGEEVLTPESLDLIEKTKARRLGLMLPDEIRGLRERLDLTQDEICELLQIGAKTYTRWETGRARPSRSMNVLLCALRDGVITVEYLRSLREGTDWEVIRSWRLAPRLNFWEVATGRSPARPVSPTMETRRWLVHRRVEGGKIEALAEMTSRISELFQEHGSPNPPPSTSHEPGRAELPLGLAAQQRRPTDKRFMAAEQFKKEQVPLHEATPRYQSRFAQRQDFKISVGPFEPPDAA